MQRVVVGRVLLFLSSRCVFVREKRQRQGRGKETEEEQREQGESAEEKKKIE